MTRKTAFGLVLLLLVVAAVAAGAAYVFSGGFSAREEPGAVETFIAGRLRHLAVPRASREATNPVAASPEMLSEAMEHFADHCATCHANNGSGDTAIGQGLYPKPPDMRLAATQELSDGELYYIIHNGIRFTGMPAFGPAEGEDLDSWKMVHFIRHLTAITDEELERMKEMNPTSPHHLKEEEEMRRFLEGHDDPPSNETQKHH
jgi:mono/diheme cytochrome c family protein